MLILSRYPAIRQFLSTLSNPITALIFAAFGFFALSIPAARSRGGGGGGGHGGGGGGGHSSGFGGGGFGGGGFGGGGFGGGHYYGGGGYYGGSHYYGGGGYGGGDVFFWILLIIAVIFLMIMISSISNARRTLVVVTMVLKNGRQYTSMMERFTANSNFDSAQGRTYVAHEVIHNIHDIDIFLGKVKVLSSSSNGLGLGDEAKLLWQTEMRKGDVKADVINVSSPTGKMKASFGTPTLDPSSAAEYEEGFALVSIIVTASGVWSRSGSQRGDVVNAIQRLASSNIDALYFYYTPSAGQAMTRGEAISLLESL
jgi:heterogeneous nuclear ribonucleoprotein F/H